LPIVAATVMIGFMHFLLRAGWTPDQLAPAPIRLVLAGIIPLQLLGQTVMTAHWASFRQDVATLVTNHTGIIPWQIADRELNQRGTVFRWHLIYVWTIQPLSMVLAPDGKVRSAVGARPGSAWKEFQLDDPASLPLCAVGFDWSAYLAALGKTGPEAKTACPSR